MTAEKDHCRVELTGLPEKTTLRGAKGVGQVPMQEVDVTPTQAGEVLHETCSTSSLAVRSQEG